MKIFVTERQYNNFLFESENVIEPKLVKFFKFLNEEKKKYRRKSQLLERITQLSKYLNIPEGHERYILELYLLNYREDGDYSSITPDNFIDPRKQRGKWTPNTKSYMYARTLMPFKASNLEGYWSSDRMGREYYVVMSYGWYPIYVYKDGKWYEVTKRYSSSTSRQMSNVYPVKHNSDLDVDVILATPDEMKMLQSSATYDEIKKHKLSSLEKAKKSLTSPRLRTLRAWDFWGDPGQDERVKINIKFKIDSIEIEGEKAIVNVNIYDVVKRDPYKEVKTPENYLKGELAGIDKEYVENKLEQKLKGEFREFFDVRYKWNEPLSEKHNIVFKFHHLKA